MDFLNTLASNIENFLNAISPFVWILVAVAVFGMGGACIIGTSQSREAVKAKAPYICVGAVLILCAVEIGKSLASMLTVTPT